MLRIIVNRATLYDHEIALSKPPQQIINDLLVCRLSVVKRGKAFGLRPCEKERASVGHSPPKVTLAMNTIKDAAQNSRIIKKTPALGVTSSSPARPAPSHR